MMLLTSLTSEGKKINKNERELKYFLGRKKK